MDPRDALTATDEERELERRDEEMSPHHKAAFAVLKLWTTLTYPLTVAGALVVASLVAIEGPGYANPLTILLTYTFIAVPGCLAGLAVQTRARRWFARRIIHSLDEGARAAVSAGLTSAGFLGSSSGRVATVPTEPTADDDTGRVDEGGGP